METLHPRVRIVWAVGAVVTGVVVGALLAGIDAVLNAPGPAVVAGVALAVTALGVTHALLRYRAWGYAVEEDALYLERGVLTKVESSVPFVRVQHVDTQRGPLERAAGLASVVVYTAGSRGADVAVPGLRPDQARDLRERLRDLAIESEGEDAV